MKIVKVRAEMTFTIWVEFDDGAEGRVDLSDLAGRGVFAAWDDDGAFGSVSIGAFGELVWECGVDLCPDSIYLRLTGKSPADIFPILRDEPRCA